MDLYVKKILVIKMYGATCVNYGLESCIFVEVDDLFIMGS